MTNEKLLKIEDLRLYYRTGQGIVKAVDGINFEMGRNEAVVILGESGCGKTSLTRALLRLLPNNVEQYTGRVHLDGLDIMSLTEDNFRREVRWSKISMVPQAAMNSLNPVLKVADQVTEPLTTHTNIRKTEAIDKAAHIFQNVGVPVDFLNRYAFELSGGMRQRTAIAMALITDPDLIILDEPTSALDVLTQANIMNVLKKIKWESNTSFILITHDIATSSELADKVAVMYAGQMVEVSDAERFFQQPQHPYSQKLLGSVPKLRQVEEPDFITGQPPSLLALPSGCRFAERCSQRFDPCSQTPPVINDEDRWTQCWLYDQKNGQNNNEHNNEVNV
ncbi:MAG: ABC transporter ATP-binding protein [Chloroflexota bacterium]